MKAGPCSAAKYLPVSKVFNVGGSAKCLEKSKIKVPPSSPRPRPTWKLSSDLHMCTMAWHMCVHTCTYTHNMIGQGYLPAQAFHSRKDIWHMAQNIVTSAQEYCYLPNSSLCAWFMFSSDWNCCQIVNASQGTSHIRSFFPCCFKTFLRQCLARQPRVALNSLRSPGWAFSYSSPASASRVLGLQELQRPFSVTTQYSAQYKETMLLMTCKCSLM